MSHHLLTILILFFVFNSCSKENDFTPHPLPDKMPHADDDSEILDIQSISESDSSPPQSLKLLQDFLVDESKNFKTKKLDILATDKIDISFLSSTDILVLDKENNQLIQYNLETDENTVVASQGRGPGDLLYTQELNVHNKVAYVAMQGFQISVFDCNLRSCEHDNTILTEYNNYSIAAADKHLFVLGIPPFGRDQDPDPTNTDQYIIHRFNHSGKKEQSFTPVYRETSPVVRTQMTSGGQVRSFPQFNMNIVTFDFFHYLYLYNDEGDLLRKFQIPDLKQGYYEYKENKGGGFTGRLRYDDNSKIIRTTNLGDNWLLLIIREQRGVEFINLEEGFKGDEWFSFYAFNIKNHILYKIGDHKKFTIGKSRSIQVSEHGIIVNENGTIFFLSI